MTYRTWRKWAELPWPMRPGFQTQDSPTILPGTKCGRNICDYFSKWSKTFALEDHKAGTVADVLVTEIFLKLGIPRFIHSDKATEFMYRLTTELQELLEIQSMKTCPYQPQSDGSFERLNRTLIYILSKFFKKNLNDCDNNLPYLINAYRATRNWCTQCSPNLLLLGRETSFPVNLIYPDERVRLPLSSKLCWMGPSCHERKLWESQGTFGKSGTSKTEFWWE